MSKARSILGLLIMCGAAAAAIAQSPPEIDISQTWLSSSRVRTKAIRRPSGDQRGSASLTLPTVKGSSSTQRCWEYFSPSTILTV